jgi:glycosyltransferase involved in cell wall biosynthesis
MTDLPRVSVLIPARDEEASIERCLRSVLEQTYPHELIEIVVADGGSRDRTREVAVDALTSSAVAFAVVDGPGSTPANLNAGLRACSGDVVCRVDARSLLPPHYLATCVADLEQPEVAVVGGRQEAVARDDTPIARGIARALNNRLATGLARYRRSKVSGATDTVYLGAFRRDDLERVGGWDEALATNQDFDLNQRLARDGAVWFDADLTVGYLPRADLGSLLAQYHRFGRWKVRYWRMRGERPAARQLVLLAIPPACGVALLAIARRRGVLVAGGAALAGAAALDHLGVDEGESPEVRAVGALAASVVAAGWWTGVARELLRPERMSL